MRLHLLGLVAAITITTTVVIFFRVVFHFYVGSMFRMSRLRLAQSCAAESCLSDKPTLVLPHSTTILGRLAHRRGMYFNGKEGKEAVSSAIQPPQLRSSSLYFLFIFHTITILPTYRLDMSETIILLPDEDLHGTFATHNSGCNPE